VEGACKAKAGKDSTSDVSRGDDDGHKGGRERTQKKGVRRLGTQKSDTPCPSRELGAGNRSKFHKEKENKERKVCEDKHIERKTMLSVPTQQSDFSFLEKKERKNHRGERWGPVGPVKPSSKLASIGKRKGHHGWEKKSGSRERIEGRENGNGGVGVMVFGKSFYDKNRGTKREGMS